jgi:hypothetical protein
MREEPDRRERPFLLKNDANLFLIEENTLKIIVQIKEHNNMP